MLKVTEGASNCYSLSGVDRRGDRDVMHGGDVIHNDSKCELLTSLEPSVRIQFTSVCTSLADEHQAQVVRGCVSFGEAREKQIRGPGDEGRGSTGRREGREGWTVF